MHTDMRSKQLDAIQLSKRPKFCGAHYVVPKCRKHSVANIVRDTVFAGAVGTQNRPTLPPHSFCHIGHEISVPLINTRGKAGDDELAT